MTATLNLVVTWIVLPPHPNLKGMQATNMIREMRLKDTEPQENVVIAYGRDDKCHCFVCAKHSQIVCNKCSKN